MNSASFPLIAIVDLGSNSFHAAVFKLDKSAALESIESYKEILRFVDSIEKEGQLSQKDIAAGIACLKRIQNFIKPYAAEIRVVATHAIRTSTNFDKFLTQVEEETGLRVEIVDGMEEARLCYLGMQVGLDLPDEVTLGVDLGGGSTEIVIARKSKLLHLTSLHLGAASLQNRFLMGESSLRKGVKNLKSYLVSRLIPVALQLREFHFKVSIASSGTAKTLALLDRFQSSESILPDINGYKLSADSIAHIEKHLIKLGHPEKIQKFYGIERRRAEIILSGCVVFACLTELLDIKDWIISDYGFREGAALDWYSKNYGIQQGGTQDLRLKTLKFHRQKYGLSCNDIPIFAQTALDVCKKLEPLFANQISWPTDIQMGEILTASAYLHDIGKYVNVSRYHKHSYYLISQGQLLGYSQKERQLIALVTRFCRKKPARIDKVKIKPYLRENLQFVNFLSSCIRLAKIFTRNQQTEIPTFTISGSSAEVSINLIYRHPETWDIELQLLRREIKHIEAALECTLLYNAKINNDES